MGDKDKIFKTFFSDKIMVRDLLCGFLSNNIVRHLDFESLEKVNGNYVTDDLRERFDDIVWKVKYGKEWFYLYILLEFQSTIDKYMAVRILTYVGLLYQDLIKSSAVDKSGITSLPPILPIVIYDGKQSWNAANEVFDLIHKTTPELDKHIPHLEYAIIDIGGIEQEKVNNLPKTVGSVFEISRSQSFKDIQKSFQKYLEWMKAPKQERLRRTFIVWFNRIIKNNKQEHKKFNNLTTLQEVGSMLCEMENWSDELINKGLQQGIQQGIEIGEARGEARGEKIGKKIGEARGEKIGKKIGEARGEKIGEEKRFEQIVYAMHRQGLSADKIALFTEQPLEKVESVISHKSTQLHEDNSEYNAKKKIE